MKALRGLPVRVRSMEGLGRIVGALNEVALPDGTWCKHFANRCWPEIDLRKRCPAEPLELKALIAFDSEVSDAKLEKQRRFWQLDGKVHADLMMRFTSIVEEVFPDAE